MNEKPLEPPPALSLRVSLVVPVYRGERTLEALVDEIVPLTSGAATPAGRAFKVVEVVLVNDGASDGSAGVMTALATKHAFVSPVWLSRNYGQHPATLAGIATTTGEWIVTLDEDGQHDPAQIGRLLDEAFSSESSLVYAKPSNPPPHGLFRNFSSWLAKRFVSLLTGDRRIERFNSFRLIDGEIGRSLAAYCGHGVYLDVALTWVTDRAATAAIPMREERGRASGYSFLKLLAHFWRLAITSGTRPLRAIAFLGALAILVAIALTGKALWEKMLHAVPVPGWASLTVILSFFSGVTLVSLCIIAEYLGLTLNMAMGKPPYVVVSRPPKRGGIAQ